MPKTCNHEGCSNNVFSTGYCKIHQYKRTDEKYKRSMLRRYEKPSQPLSPSKNYKIPHKSKTVSEVSEWGYTRQLDMFVEIWDNMDKPRLCPISGQEIDKFYNTKMWFSCFAHVLAKGMYRKYKLNPFNIMVVHPEVHRMIDQGTQADRDRYPTWNWDIFYEKQLQLKEEYEQYIKKHK